MADLENHVALAAERSRGGLSSTESHSDLRARLEAKWREEEARCEYGRIVADVLRFLRRARDVQVAVRISDNERSTTHTFLTVGKGALLASLKYRESNEAMPCAFDPVTSNLCIGSLRAIRRADDDAALLRPRRAQGDAT